LLLHLREGTDREGRKRTLYRHYREAICAEIPHLRDRWEATTGLTASTYRIKFMRTKWGSCTVADRRIWLNVELAKHPRACLSYIVLHELLHLRERGHTPAFRALLTRYLPGWERLREELNTGFPGLPGLR
jgi:predicted metal-dependent hydrolase